jgi:iron complex outermembrane receptor protein
MKKKGLIITGLLSLALIPTFSQESIKDTISMDEVVVTGSKTPQSVGNVTQKIDIIDSKEISNLVTGNRNVSEVLMYKPGASGSVLSRNDANWGAYGGIGPKYSTFLFQGLPVDAFVDPMALDLSAISRIEVQRGPASVLYPNYLSQDFAGNQSSLAGTVNLIMKEHIDKDQTNLKLGYGSYNTKTGNIYHQTLANNNIAAFVGANVETSDYTSYGQPHSWLDTIIAPKYTKTRLLGGFIWGNSPESKQKFTIFLNQTFHNGTLGRPNRGFNHNYSLLNAAYTFKFIPDATFAFKTGLRRYDRQWQNDNYNPSATIKDYSYNSSDNVVQTIIPADISVNYKYSENFSVIAGADGQYGQYNTFNQAIGKDWKSLNDAISFQTGAYIQPEVHIENLTLRAGGRYNYLQNNITLFGGSKPGNENQSWNALLWNAGLKYNIDKIASVYANAGNSFLTPGLKSIGGTIAANDTTAGQLPNKDLKPESGLAFDAGFDLYLADGLKFGARYFRYFIKDAIIDVVMKNNISQTRSENADTSIVNGIEVSISHKVSNSFSWFANYTNTKSIAYNDTNDNKQILRDAQTPFVPLHSGNAGFSVSLTGDLIISPYVHVTCKIYDGMNKTRVPFDGHEVININITKHIIDYKLYNITAFADLYNITDRKFDMPWAFRDPGFSFMAGIKATF